MGIKEVEEKEYIKKAKELVAKAKAKYEALPPKKKNCVKYGVIALAGAVVGGTITYLLGRQNK